MHRGSLFPFILSGDRHRSRDAHVVVQLAAEKRSAHSADLDPAATVVVGFSEIFLCFGKLEH